MRSVRERPHEERTRQSTESRDLIQSSNKKTCDCNYHHISAIYEYSSSNLCG